MNNNGSTSLWTSFLVFLLLLLVIFAALNTIGQKSTPASSSRPVNIQANTQSSGSTRSTTYNVKPGDTLSSIADHFGVTLSALEHANPQITDPTLIFPGELINVPS